MAPPLDHNDSQRESARKANRSSGGVEQPSYRVIARKYRPQNFEEVIGQDPVTTTLKNAITLNRIGHAYLFTGPRGVGKTSMARIFAKALNCQAGPTITPCGRCRTCEDIENSRSLDVFEIDGASNRGIDEIRALRENVKFAPSSGKYKIYIIDEVHQITTDGFNALLKTLEEPPAHVKFIFATTSAQKVPATILSRCQRFDFRRMTVDTLASALKEVAKKEKIKINEEALFLIAKSADGSMRDGQSLLDQMASSGLEKLTRDDVIRSLGILQEDQIVDLAQSLADRDALSALKYLDTAMREGKEPILFLEKMMEHVRNLLFVQVSDTLLDLIEAPETYKAALLKQKTSFSREDLFYIFSVLNHTHLTLKRFESKRIPLEMAILKIAHRVPMENIAALLDRLKSPSTSPMPLSLTKKKNLAIEEDSEAPETEELPSGDITLESPTKKSTAALEAIWEPLIRALKAEKISVASYLAEGQPKDLGEGVVTIAFPERLNFHKECLETADNKKLIEKYFSQFLDQPVRVQFESVKETPGRAGLEPDSRSATAPKISAEAEGVLKSAMNLFGGRVVPSR